MSDKLFFFTNSNFCISSQLRIWLTNETLGWTTRDIHGWVGRMAIPRMQWTETKTPTWGDAPFLTTTTWISQSGWWTWGTGKLSEASSSSPGKAEVKVFDCLQLKVGSFTFCAGAYRKVRGIRRSKKKIGMNFFL